MPKLKSCPFCGASWIDLTEFKFRNTFECKHELDCFLSDFWIINARDTNKIKAWNTRVDKKENKNE